MTIPFEVFCAALILLGTLLGAFGYYWLSEQNKRSHFFQASCGACGEAEDIYYRDWEAALLRAMRFARVHVNCVKPPFAERGVIQNGTLDNQ